MERSKFYQIKNVTEHEYTLVCCDGSVITRPIQDIDKSASAFTIQDAKDGDVLAIDPWSDYPSSFVAIYKKQNEEDLDSYCFVGFDGKFYKGENGHSTEDIHPATKEQRDLLFQKMKEAGYQWDAEKKKLKKIEQKPTWSEEDENYHRICLDLCTGMPNGGVYAPYIKDEAINWLKSLKDRYTWKPNEEQMAVLNEVINYAANSELQHWSNFIYTLLKSLCEQLKKLREE